MSPDLAPYVILAWLVGVVLLFPSLPPHRAAIVVVLSGALFLPEAVGGVVEIGPIKLSKVPAVGYAWLLAALLYDSGRLFAFAPRWFDWPVLLWCLWPLPSALANDPPPDGSSALRDALSQTLGVAVGWGAPYLLGRVYFADRAAARDLAVGVVVAAAVYAPLCLWEARVSPQLHGAVYGYSQHSFEQTIRYDGYRPVVFMQHGLAVGFFMASGALLAAWLRRPLGLPGAAWLLVPVAVVVKSTGAIALGLAGATALVLARATGSRWWLLLLVAAPVGYCAARAGGGWSGAGLVELSASVEEGRGRSLEFRLTNEDLLIARALERPLTGWGGWGRHRVVGEWGGDIAVTDGLWVIILGERGAVGLALLGAALLLPVARFALRSDPARWRDPDIAPAAGMATVVALWACDGLFNAMPSPVYLVLAAAVAGHEPDPAEGRAGVGGEHPH